MSAKIRDFKPMRSCAPTAEHPLRFPCLGSFKLDGIRIVKHEGKALTKSLKHIPNRSMAKWVEANLFDGMDGEVISGPPNVESVYTQTFTATMTQEGSFEFTIFLFDIHNRQDLYATERYELLKKQVASLSAEVAEKVAVVEKRMLTCMEEFEAMYAEALELGYEGLITQAPDGFYKYGKCTARENVQLKHKPETDAECVIIGAYEAMYNGNEAFTNEVGETARSSHKENLIGKGMLGGFHARDLETGVDFDVAPGKMKHEERVKVWQEYCTDPSKYIGKMVRYRCMGYGEMANGRPRHGRFYGWRDASDMSLD